MTSAYPISDRRFVVLVIVNAERERPQLAVALGYPKWLDDERFAGRGDAMMRNRIELIALNGAQTAKLTKKDLMTRQDGHQIARGRLGAQVRMWSTTGSQRPTTRSSPPMIPARTVATPSTPPSSWRGKPSALRPAPRKSVLTPRRQCRSWTAEKAQSPRYWWKAYYSGGLIQP